jgi:hypothetical protein
MGIATAFGLWSFAGGIISARTVEAAEAKVGFASSSGPYHPNPTGKTTENTLSLDSELV